MTLFLLAILGLCNDSQADPSARRADIEDARADAMENQLLDLEDWVDEFGGLQVIRDDAEVLRNEISRRFSSLLQLGGGRRVQVGKNQYQRGLTERAIAAEWERASGDAIEAVIDFDRQLKSMGVDLIVCPVPAKMELYYEDCEIDLPERFPASVPRIERMFDLLEADVEVVDILQAFWEAKPNAEVPLYELNGHHPSGLGARVAAELVAERLARYDFTGQDPERFSERRRTGTERVDPSVPMKAWQVVDEERGLPYEHVEDGEIVVIGDSHAFAYFTASWASHIARTTGVPITDLSESSGGGRAHLKLGRLGRESLAKRKVVVWILTGVILGSSSMDKAVITEQPMPVDDGFTADEVRGRIEEFRAQKKEDPNARIGLSEGQLNKIGYDLIKAEEFELAVEVLRATADEYPTSANAYDSLGEALILVDRPDEAIVALQRSLELNPSDGLRRQTLTRLATLGVEVELPRDTESR